MPTFEIRTEKPSEIYSKVGSVGAGSAGIGQHNVRRHGGSDGQLPRRGAAIPGGHRVPRHRRGGHRTALHTAPSQASTAATQTRGAHSLSAPSRSRANAAGTRPTPFKRRMHRVGGTATHYEPNILRSLLTYTVHRTGLQSFAESRRGPGQGLRPGHTNYLKPNGLSGPLRDTAQRSRAFKKFGALGL